MPTGNYMVTAHATQTQIVFSLFPNLTGLGNKEQQDLVFSVEAVLETIRGLYLKGDRETFDYYFEQLLRLSQVGLVGENCQPTLSKRALEQIKWEVTRRESAKIKNAYLRKLGSRAVYLGLPVFVLLIIIYKFYLTFFDGYFYLVTMLFIWPGCMLGVWLSFAITRPFISFDDLIIIEKDGLEPTIRLLFTGLLACVFGLLFLEDIMTIKLGQFSSVDIQSNPTVAFLAGILLGVNEKIIGNTLTRKTSTILKSK